MIFFTVILQRLEIKKTFGIHIITSSNEKMKYSKVTEMDSFSLSVSPEFTAPPGWLSGDRVGTHDLVVVSSIPA